MTDNDRALESLLRFGAPEPEIYTKRCGPGLHYVREKHSGALLGVASKKKLSRKARLKYGPEGGRWNIRGVGLIETYIIYENEISDEVVEEGRNVAKGLRFASVIPKVEGWLKKAITPERRWEFNKF